jgi:hypothetical protein
MNDNETKITCKTNKLKTVSVLSIIAFISVATGYFAGTALITNTQPGTNIIMNPGFEVLNWNLVTHNGNMPVWDSTTYHSGTTSGKIYIPGRTNVISGDIWSDYISTSPGKTFLFSAWGKTQGTGGANNPAVRLAEYDANHNWLRQTSLYYAKGTVDWTYLDMVFTTGENTAYINAYANIWNGYGTFWVDDVSLIPQDAAPTPTITTVPTVTITPTITPTPQPTSTTPVSGAYYVATNGNDNNPGTQTSPWRTIQKAANTLIAGQTAYVRAGTYYEKVQITRSGSSGKYITLSAYPGESVTIDANGKVGSWDGAVHVNSANWIRIVGFNVINSGWNGIMISDFSGGSPSNIYIQNNTIHAIKRSGLYAEDASYITYDGNTVYDTQQAGSSGGQQNENVNIIRTNNFEIKNNRVYGCPNYESIDVKEGSSYGSIHHNDISGAHSAGIYIDAQGRDSQNIEIYNNKVHDSLESGARGIAIGVENSGSAKNMKVYNNIVHNMGAIGIVPGTSYSAGAVDNIAVVNNVVYDNGQSDGWGGGIIVEYGSATNMVLRNNIAYGNHGRGDIVGNGHTVQDHNLPIGVNPLFVNPGSDNFHLQSGSPAINAGSSIQFVPSFDMDGSTRPQGTGYDIGAYEQQ